MVELEKLKKYRFTEKEYDMVCDVLKRPPQGIEWALFSALWSEHCSYKSSKNHLKKFFNKNDRVLVSEGENSGVIDLGKGERISFKMESHNHPSFIEPYQGAATGVGGILRDIFTMGARPIMLANYLCFGEKEAPRMKKLVEGVVSGISGYGNCVGVPNVTGFTEFHSSYNKNILVNALAMGVFYPEDPIALSKAEGVGNCVVYVGAKTGRDGIHGASMASQSFDDKSSQSRPTVQIGDPFFEKLLIESCLEVIKAELVVAIQDMGAAGLISSSFEMASKGRVGLKLHLDQVPLRDSTLTPEDILLSESQERMLLVCTPKNLKPIQDIFKKWGLDATQIGEVTKKPEMQLFWHNELLTEIDPDLLVENAPRYDRPYSEYKPKNRGTSHLDIFTLEETLNDIFKSEEGTSREWIYRQYDQRVGSQTARDCSNTIGVVQMESSKRGLGLALGCRPYLMRLDARIGALDAVFYPALSLAVKGFEPLALTDCLNFGNPENKDIMCEFVTSVESISEACKSINSPVISGNVSFYNETLKQNITSTPATAIAGIRDSVRNIPEDVVTSDNKSVYLICNHQIETGGALEELYKKKIHGNAGDINCETTATWLTNIREVANFKGVVASRAVGKFGLLPSLIKMTTDTGFVIEKLPPFLKAKGDFFKERLFEAIFVVENEKQFEAFLRDRNLDFHKLGFTKHNTFDIASGAGMDKTSLPFQKIKNVYHKSWEKIFG